MLSVFRATKRIPRRFRLPASRGEESGGAGVCARALVGWRLRAPSPSPSSPPGARSSALTPKWRQVRRGQRASRGRCRAQAAASALSASAGCAASVPAPSNACAAVTTSRNTASRITVLSSAARARRARRVARLLRDRGGCVPAPEDEQRQEHAAGERAVATDPGRREPSYLWHQRVDPCVSGVLTGNP